MNEAKGSGAIPAREQFIQELAPLGLSARMPASLRGPDAAACEQASAVFEVIEELAFGASGEGARVARQAGAWAMRTSHRRYWAARTPSGEAGLVPLGSFGGGHLVTPCAIETGADGNLWIASLGAERITVLTPEGGLVRHVPLPGARPWGLFPAGDGTIWACDFARPRLERIAPDGSIVQGIALPHSSGDDLRPILGAASGADIFLILADGRGGARRLARLRADGSGLEFLPCPVLNPSCVRVRDGLLHVSSLNPAFLLARPLDSGDWFRVNAGLLPEYLTRFDFAGPEAWLTARRHLIRLGRGGEVEMIVDAGGLAGYPEANLCDVAGLQSSRERRLYAVDNIHNLVHSYRIG
ncbi:hypothetical protein M7784_01645 [Desulfovibrio aminophilus]|nr:hypothetical protein [Desulfovibrio aminophilus]MCM0753949.1 hypothetical protein [Desulfovibrio aminophilus]